MYGCCKREDRYDQRSFDTGGTYRGMLDKEDILKRPYTTLQEMRELYQKSTANVFNQNPSRSDYRANSPVMIGYAPGTSGSGTPGLSDSYFAQIASARETKSWQGH